MNNNEKLLDIFKDIFQVEEVKDEDSQDTIEDWDSVGTIDLIGQLENAFSVKFSLLEVEELKTVAIVKELLKEKGVTFDD